MRRLTIVILAAAMACGLSACGRKGRPLMPEDSVYPRFYPDVAYPDRGAYEGEFERDEGVIGEPQDQNRRKVRQRSTPQNQAPETQNP